MNVFGVLLYYNDIRAGSDYMGFNRYRYYNKDSDNIKLTEKKILKTVV